MNIETHKKFERIINDYNSIKDIIFEMIKLMLDISLYIDDTDDIDYFDKVENEIYKHYNNQDLKTLYNINELHESIGVLYSYRNLEDIIDEYGIGYNKSDDYTEIHYIFDEWNEAIYNGTIQIKTLESMVIEFQEVINWYIKKISERNNI